MDCFARARNDGFGNWWPRGNSDNSTNKTEARQFQKKKTLPSLVKPG